MVTALSFKLFFFKWNLPSFMFKWVVFESLERLNRPPVYKSIYDPFGIQTLDRVKFFWKLVLCQLVWLGKFQTGKRRTMERFGSLQRNVISRNLRPVSSWKEVSKNGCPIRNTFAEALAPARTKREEFDKIWLRIVIIFLSPVFSRRRIDFS